MRHFITSAVIAAALASGSAKAAEPAAEFQIDKTHADAPLKFLDIWSRAKFRSFKISPDGKYFAGGEVLENGRSILHIVDRKTMKIIHSEQFDGDISIDGIDWHNKDYLVISPSGKSKISEGRYGIGSFLLNIHNYDLRPIYAGDTADYGGNEGGGLIDRIDEDNYYMSISPSGSSFDEFPFNYLYRVNVMTGRAIKIMKAPSREANFIIKSGRNGAPDEVTYAVGYVDDYYYGMVVHKRVGDKWEKVAEYDMKKGAYLPVRWSETDPDKMLWVDTRETQTGAYYWVNMKTGERELVYHDPKVQIDGIKWDDDDEALYAQTSYDYPKVVPLQPKARPVIELQKLRAAFPGSEVHITSTTDDGFESVVVVTNDQDRGKFYLYNHYDGKIRFLLDPKPDVDASKMPKMYAVNYKARDGMDLVAYLTVPQQKPMKNLPLIILPHGGPHGPRDFWGFNMEPATFANAGYAVLQINYRGSGGYGKDFEFQWYKHWGLEMQDDLEDGVKWAVKEGIADPDKVCIYGASYGGYAALMGVVKTPDLYKCSIGYVGVYDLKIQVHDSDTALSKAGRRYLREALGTDDKDLDARSSTPNADRIKAPVFLVEGMLDARVHPKNYWGMREALKKRGHRFETLEIPRTGHGAQDLESHREIYCRMVDFFDRYIGPKKPDDKPNDCKFPGDKPLPYKYYDGTYYEGSK